MTRLLKLLQSCNENQEIESQKNREEIKALNSKISDLEFKFVRTANEKESFSKEAYLEERIALLEKTMNEKKQFHLENEKEIIGYVDKRLDEMEEKNQTYVKRIEEIMERQGTDIASEMANIEKNIKTSKIGEESEIIASSMRNEVEKIEKAVNEWIKNIEEHLNV